MLAQVVQAISLLKPLRFRDFRLVWGGQLLSRVGDTVLSVALPWLVYDLTGSPVAMGTVVLLQNLPMLALLLAGGIAVDRLPRKHVMIASDVLRGAVALGLALLISRGEVQLWHLQAMAALFGAAGAFFRPAYSSIAPELVPKEELVAANSLISGGGSLAQVVGPLLGATLVVAGGTGIAFAFDAATFAISAACLVAMKSGRARSEASEKRAVKAELAEGFRVVISRTWLWLAIAIASVENAIGAATYIVVLPLLVREQLGGEVEALGAIQSMVAVGTFVAMVAVAQHGMRKHRGIWFWAPIAIHGLTLVGLGAGRSLPEALVFAVIFGVAGSVASVAWTASLQELIDPNVLGRVTSIDILGSAALTPIGFLAIGALAEVLGPATVFILSGVVIAALAGSALLIPAARRFE